MVNHKEALLFLKCAEKLLEPNMTFEKLTLSMTKLKKFDYVPDELKQRPVSASRQHPRPDL
jgi:hypothetical protein